MGICTIYDINSFFILIIVKYLIGQDQFLFDNYSLLLLF